jgi:predicted secreted protein
MSRMNKFMISVLALIMITLTACSSLSANAAADPVAISASDAGKTIELKKGDTLVISLEGNVTTGFNWWVAEPAPAILEEVGDPEVKPASGAIGAGGTIVLKFSAVQAGQATLKLEYKRIWEKDVPAAETFEVNVVVK